MHTDSLTESPAADAPAADPIHALVKRLSRPHPSGGAVIERATILAEGSDFAAILAWIADHAGEPEVLPSAAPGGLHGARGQDRPAESPAPLRYVLPAGTV